MTWLMTRADDLDADTAERMLRGAVAPDDAPNALAGTAALLQAARRPLTAADPAVEERTLAAMVAAIGSSAPTRTNNRRSTMNVTTKLAAGAAVGVISLFGGLTAASALSGTVSSDVTHTTGVSLPFAATSHPDADASHSTTTDKSETADTDEANSPPDVETTETEKPDATDNSSTDNHGACVSAVAKATTPTTSSDPDAHGDAVSKVAKSDCGKTSNGSTTKGSTTQGPTTPTTSRDDKGDATSSSTDGDAHADANAATPDSHATSGQATAGSHRP